MRRPRVLLRAAVALAVALTSSVVLNSPRASAVDIYTEPGQHTVGGRQWSTTCAPYSTTITRCTTKIWATTVVYTNGRYVSTTGWAFNNLTYKTSPRAGWEPFNHLVTPGEHVIDGRRWKTECYTAWTGPAGCRSQIWASVVGTVNGRYQYVNQWVFNNQVRVTQTPCVIPLATVRAAVGQPGIAPVRCTVSKTNATWAAVEYVVSDADGGTYMETAFFRKGATAWTLVARSGQSASHICTWFRQAGVPLDLLSAVRYCFS